MNYLPYMIVMSLVTYLIRMLPLTLFQKEIKNIYIRSFLYYIPYAVLAAMSFPAILTCSEHVIASAAGMLVAIILAYREKNLLWVAICACITVYVVSLIG